nr:FCD domain-containing protein [Marinicella sp. W31]MDC2877923.1 FCD domain-containing protein [Marinicella sp. W31]
MIRNTFQMRAALEREAVMHAVQHMSDTVLESQRKLHIEIIDAVRKAPTPELLARGQEVDTGFHNLLISATDNELLRSAYNINAIRMRLIKLDRIRLNETVLPEAFGDHLAVIDAIQKRDLTAAVEAMDKHVRNARNRALQL